MKTEILDYRQGHFTQVITLYNAIEELKFNDNNKLN